MPKLKLGKNAKNEFMIPISIPTGIVELKAHCKINNGSMLLTQAEYDYALLHGLSALVMSSTVSVVFIEDKKEEVAPPVEDKKEEGAPPVEDKKEEVAPPVEDKKEEVAPPVEDKKEEVAPPEPTAESKNTRSSKRSKKKSNN